MDVVSIPCTTLALAAGHDRLVSVVALGALLARRSLVSPTAIRDALRDITGSKHADLLEADLAAFEAGLLAGAAALRPGVEGSLAAR